MAETVGQHSVAAFTSPVNGTSPIDANTVKGNDNTIRSAYVDHDADPGIHVQSSTLASRPVANSAGRKWMTQDSGVIRLFYDDGTSWYEVDYLRTTGGTISGNLSITGTLAVTGVATFTAQPILSSLTASRAVFTDGSKGLVSNAITGTGDVVMSASPTLTGTITAASATLSGTLGVSGLLTFASLKGTGATTVTNILDEDNMASDSATALATQQSIKAYVDAQVGASDALSEVLAIGNTTGANDIIVSAGQKIRTPAVAAQDGSSAITIANTTGALTLATALADSNLATISTAGKVSNSATTATDANTASAIVARDASGNFTAGTITAALTGNASTATTLQTARNINGVSFNGSADITVTAAAGTLTGTTLASNVTASSLTSVGTLANLTVTNPITGSVTGSSGSTTGNAATATALQTARNINGVSFNGTADITVTAAAGTLTGTTLASGVTASSLTSVGTLSSLTVSGTSTSSRLRLSDSTLSGYGGVEFTSLAGFGLGIASTAYSFRAGNGTTEYVNIASNGNLAVDTNTLYVDAANNRVGVGTASPSETLDVRGTGNFNAVGGTYLGFQHNGTLAGYVGTANAIITGGATTNLGILSQSALVFASGGSTERMRLDTSGNLGLGVTPSAWSASFKALQVSGLGALWGSSTGFFMSNNTYNDGSNKYIGNGLATRYYQSTGQHIWENAPNNTSGASAAATLTQVMTLSSSDRGILTVGPSGEVGSIGTGYATIGTWNTSGGGFRILRGTGSGTATSVFYGDSTATTIGSQEATPLVFWTNTTERARIDSSGNLGIGTTSPAERLHVAGGCLQVTGALSSLNRASSSIVDQSGNALRLFAIGPDASTHGLITFNTSTTSSYTERARITSAGEFLVGTTGVNAGERFGVRGVGSTNATYITVFENSSGGRAFSIEGAGRIDTGTLGDSPYNYVVGGTNRDLYVDSTGKLGYVSSVLASKTNIAPVTDADWLLDLNPVTFNFRKKDEDGNYTDEADGPLKHGLIAEEVEAVNPDLCFYDDEASGGALRGVNYTHLITPMLKLVQAQQAKIESLEARLAALES